MGKKTTPAHLLMVASECRGFVKIGGLGDVVRDLSTALAENQTKVSVVLPYYEVITEELSYLERLTVRFAGNDYSVRVFTTTIEGVDYYLIKSGEFFGGDYKEVYIDSGVRGGGPFEDDAKRFAFFSSAVAELLLQLPAWRDVDTMHAHDWHTGVLFVQLRFNERYTSVRKRLKTFFTIHNLDYQGVRPFEMVHDSNLAAFASWAPELYRLHQEQGVFSGICDNPGNVTCFNPMRAAINLTDYVTTVSPSYALEITQPDNAERNFAGGRGLEKDLAKKEAAGALIGILNGIDYGSYDPAKLDPSFPLEKKDWGKRRDKFRERFIRSLPQYGAELVEKHGSFANRDFVLSQLSTMDIDRWLTRPLVVAVTRTVGQKMGILLSRFSDGEQVLKKIVNNDISLVLLGCGDLDNQLAGLLSQANTLFFNLFDPQCAVKLYAAGDFFLMPSYFEPCGISQMVSMRYGCLPLVHDLGGLHDTVVEGKSGFLFSGDSVDEQGAALLDAVERIIKLYNDQKRKWRAMQRTAMEQRFTRQLQAEQYLKAYSVT